MYHSSNIEISICFHTKLFFRAKSQVMLLRRVCCELFHGNQMLRASRDVEHSENFFFEEPKFHAHGTLELYKKAFLEIEMIKFSFFRLFELPNLVEILAVNTRVNIQEIIVSVWEMLLPRHTSEIKIRDASLFPHKQMRWALR